MLIAALLATCALGGAEAFSAAPPNPNPFIKEGELSLEAMPGSNKLNVVTTGLDALFGNDFVFQKAKDSARSKIVARANMLGTDWNANVDMLKRNQEALELTLQNLEDKEVTAATPAYYKAPFHAYKEGNLGWLPAMEVDSSAVSVHANIYAKEGEFEADGDDLLRSNYQACMVQLLPEALAKKLMGQKGGKVLDVGCSTGLSTMALANLFPKASITGLDLSPYMLAVGQYQLETKDSYQRARGRVQYIHGAGETSGLEESSFDLVSVCLVSHELPTEGARGVLREAFRLLKPGGALALMDMNPSSQAFQALAANPFAFAGFKSTEPYLQQYLSFALGPELEAAGFQAPKLLRNSPRHRTCVAEVAK